LTAAQFCKSLQPEQQSVSVCMAAASWSFIRRLSQAGTVLDTWLHGQKVGRDAGGNLYYRAKRTAAGQRERRWVMYNGEPEASTVPPQWHGWLHHTVAVPLSQEAAAQPAWAMPHQANQTGTQAAYLPAGHILQHNSGVQRTASSSDYEAWQPE
jgi:NADH:ubiquinone oxidoreductase subunit